MTTDEYLANAPEPQRTTLRRLRAMLREILPDATETLSYGVPALETGGAVVAGYAYFKAHCSYFPHSGSVLAELGEALEPYQWSKGALRFPIDEPLPRSLVERLVTIRRRQLGLDQAGAHGTTRSSR
jgi:uncharacterized protein YdhG (YjbR/CyaY superfamily)